MIHGIGTDIVAVVRMAEFLERHGDRGLEKLLATEEQAECRASRDQARFLAKRFAAKEAFAKALGTGVRAPVLLPAIAVSHDAAGKPTLEFSSALALYLGERQLTAHLSLSDERDYAIAFVVVEKKP